MSLASGNGLQAWGFSAWDQSCETWAQGKRNAWTVHGARRKGDVGIEHI